MIPFSDDISYADEQGGRVNTVRVYEGRDAEFTVYFDSGDGYEFEQGQYSLMELKYSEKNHELSISKSGKYPVDDSFDVEYIGHIRN